MKPSTRTGFTLLELLVVCAAIAIVAATLLPAFAKSKPDTRAIQCLNNNRQMCLAWRMYADESNDRLVYSSDDGSTLPNPLNAYAWTRTHMDYSPAIQANWDTNVDIVKGPLWPYTGKDASIYKCPSDNSVVVVNGVAKPRVRSVSMNLYLGGFAGGDGGWPSAKAYAIYTNLPSVQGGVASPGAAKLFVFLDMREDQINWGNFFTDMTGYSPNNSAMYMLQDLPGMYHSGGGSFSFADGHGELHRWVDYRTTPPLTFYAAWSPIASPRNEDVAWLQDHATRLK